MSVDMVDYIDFFSDVRPALYSWNKFHRTMVHSSAQILLNLICYLLKHPWFYDKERYGCSEAIMDVMFWNWW